MTFRPFGLWGLFGLQAFCAFFFLSDAVADLLGWETTTVGLPDSDVFEYVVTAALVFSLVLTSIEIRGLLGRQTAMESQIMVASGAFGELLNGYFDEWALTPSEREVALLAIKGFSISEIADLRDTRQGTIKAQCSAIYRKAGVSGRPQLLSIFIEDLMGESLINPAPQTRPA